MMSEKFRLAIVGAGMISRSAHLPAALASRRVEVTALVDPAIDRAAQLARSYGIDVTVAERIETVLDRIDGAIVATPNDSHAEIAMTCLNAGVPVLIEKPLAANVAEGQLIVEAARRNGTIAAVGYSTRFRHNTRLLKQLLDEQHFGNVLRFAHQFGTSGGWSPMSGYNLLRSATGGGVLVVTGTHFLDRVLHFWGYPESATLEDDADGGPEANCVATLSYRSDTRRIVGTARYSKTVPLPGGLVIETEDGFIIVADNDEAEVIFRSHAAPSIEQVVRPRGGGETQRNVFLVQLENFVEACCSGSVPEVTAEEGLLSLMLLETLYTHRRPMQQEWYARPEIVSLALA